MQPGIVAVPAVEHPDLRIEDQSEARSAGRIRPAAKDRDARALDVERPRRRQGRGATLRHAALERSIPERVERIGRAGARIDGALPMGANEVERRLRVAGSTPTGSRDRTRVVQRLNRRLRQAHDAGDRFGVAPALEIVMIGADEVREAGGLVDPLGGADEERHALEVVGQRRRIRQVVHRVDAGDEQRLRLRRATAPPAARRAPCRFPAR